MARNCGNFWEIVLAILLPPLVVWLRIGFFSLEFLICLILTILGYVPGIIYAIYVVVYQNPDIFVLETEYLLIPE